MCVCARACVCVRVHECVGVGGWVGKEWYWVCQVSKRCPAVGTYSGYYSIFCNLSTFCSYTVSLVSIRQQTRDVSNTLFMPLQFSQPHEVKSIAGVEARGLNSADRVSSL